MTELKNYLYIVTPQNSPILSASIYRQAALKRLKEEFTNETYSLDLSC